MVRVVTAMPKQIISIHGRAETGISRPFLCQDAAGQSWFVKRANVSWDQLVCEFIFGKLAADYGLPMAGFELLEIPNLLARQALAKDRCDFEPGVAFGSKRIPFGEDPGESHLRQIPDEMKIAVICFDWWTANAGRRLTKTGGSPDLIWDPVMQSITAIDHDRVLDSGFRPDEFFREHIFRDVRPFIEKDVVKTLRLQFEKSVKKIPVFWSRLPAEWLTGLTAEDIQEALLKPKHPVEGILPI